ncbi:MAG: BON domain-containing protein [Anaerolineae bacterium]
MAVGMSPVAERVTEALANDPQTAQYAIEVIDDNGLITLRGTVASEEDLTRAVEIARAQTGVLDVVNELEVEGSGEEPPIAPPGVGPAGGAGESGSGIV